MNWKRQETYEDADGSPHTAVLLPTVTHPILQTGDDNPQDFLVRLQGQSDWLCTRNTLSSNVENYHPISEVMVTGVCGRSLFFLEFVASEDQL